MENSLAGVGRDIAVRLHKAGIDNARQEAGWLVEAATGLDRTDLLSREYEVVSDAATVALEAMTRRRVAREPLQHIIGYTEFYGLNFNCDKRALVPRPDSETIVDAAISRVPPDRESQIADLGTGSGCLLAAVLANCLLAHGIGIEANEGAAALARENVQRLGLAARCDIVESDWANWDGWAMADLVMSNPPYIRTQEISLLAPEVRLYDPIDALDGGADGLNAYREILKLAAANMKAGGWLVVEIGYDQREAVESLFLEHSFDFVESGADLGGNDRVVWGRRPVS